MSTTQSNPLRVNTAAGPIEGTIDSGVRAWFGVPYAQSTAGENRFRAPKPVQPWNTVRRADRWGSLAPQPQTALFPKLDGITASEDCLSLNVWAPERTDSNTALPVMVWIHGGGYIVGASAQPVYNGRALAEAGDVVVVTINYRLGALGFLDFSQFTSAEAEFESNLGLKDIVAALHWVQANIAAFGGNPDDVTLFGQSAGAASVTTLMTVPEAKTLFHKAIAQSPPATSVYSSEHAAEVAGMYLEKLNLSGSRAAQALQSMDAERLVAPTMELLDHIAVERPGTLAFAPVVDGEFLVDYPVNVFERGEQHAIPLIIGSTHDEAALFKMMKSPLMPTNKTAIEGMFRELVAERPEMSIQPERIYDAYPDFPRQKGALQISSDAGIGMPVTWIAAAHSLVAPTFVYRFDQATPLMKLAGLGAMHASELAYVFGNIPPKPNLTKRQIVWLGGNAAAQRVSERMQSHWLEFAKTARANWPGYSVQQRATMVFDRRDSVQLDPHSNRRAAWGDRPISFR